MWFASGSRSPGSSPSGTGASTTGALGIGTRTCGLVLLIASALALACDDAPIGPIPPVGERALRDRPDDLSGRQIHVVYAVCEIGCNDRGWDTRGQLETSIALFQEWLIDQTDGRALRIDTFQGRPDITFFRVAGNRFELRALGSELVDEIWAQMRKAGFRADRKRYLIYYDGENSRSGSAQFGGDASAVYGLWADPLFSGDLEFRAVHEILHMLGFVDPAAPNHMAENPFHVDDSPMDLMWGRVTGATPPTRLDVGNDDYYGDDVPPGVRNLADSPYLGR